MSRAMYEKMAAMFQGELAIASSVHNYEERAARIAQVRSIIYSSADVFAQDNPRFNRERFYEAAGMNNGRFGA